LFKLVNQLSSTAELQYPSAFTPVFIALASALQ